LAGVDEPLRRLGSGLAQHPFDANRLVQDLIVDIGGAPGLSDGVILLWLISAAADELARSLPASDNAFQVLLRRRAELVERLAGDIDDRTFVEPDVDVFDPGTEYTPLDVTYLSPFEALLLDVALASRDDATPWLTYVEADQLFGDEATALRRNLVSTRQSFAVRAGLLVGVIGLLGALAAWFVMREYGVASDVRLPLAVAVAAIGMAFGVAVASRERPPTIIGDALGSLLVACAAIATFLAINNIPKEPLVADANGVAADVIIAAGVLALWACLAVALHVRRPEVKSDG
jgi:hypothetical protein